MGDADRQTPEVVVVTGASAGLGRAIAVEFGRHGAHVGLIARGGQGADGLEGAKRDIEVAGGQALLLPTDVADAAAVEQAAAKAEETFGPIDTWVNDAMVSVFSPFKEMTADEFKRVTEVTYLGQVYGTMAALKRMLPRDRGVIVQVGSALAYRSIPLQSAYCGAKSGIRGFTDSLRCELLHDKSNVRVTMVQMPAFNTPQFSWVKTRLPHKPQPVPPIFQPEVGARAVYFAAHHQRRELYVGFSTMKAVVGNAVAKFAAPGALDLYLARTGYQAQQYDGPVSPDRQDNLWQPVPGDHGAHGAFDDRAHSRSAALWETMHHNELTAAALVGLAGVGLGALLKARR